MTHSIKASNIMLSVVYAECPVFGIVMLNAAMLNVVMPNFVVPFKQISLRRVSRETFFQNV